MDKKLKLPHAYSEIFVQGSLLGLIFFIPLSSSLKSVFLVLSVLAILFYRRSQQALQVLTKASWFWWMLGFLSWVFLTCIWSPAPWNEQSFVLEKYSKLLWMPVLILGFSDARLRFWGLHALVAAMLLTVLVALSRKIGWTHSLLPPGSVFRNHIITGHMLAFASFVVAYYAIHNKKWRPLYLLMFLLFSYQILFISQGRTGYLMYALVMLILIVQHFKRGQLIVALLILGLSAGLVYQFSPIMQESVHRVYQDWDEMHHGDANTSLGYRVQFQKFAYSLFKQHPFIGNGAGSLTYYFDERNPVPAWGRQLREPHNQYWMIGAEYGLLGFILYLGWLMSLGLASWRLSIMRPFAFALLIPFVLGSMTDSLLFYSGCGYFFLTLMALCLSET